MTCETYQSQLSAWLDGELPSDQSTNLAAHLSVCESCRDEVDGLRDLDDALKTTFAPARERAVLRCNPIIAPLPTARDDSRPSHVVRRQWPVWLVAATAGFLLALIVFPPGKRETTRPEPIVKLPDDSRSEPKTRLALAVGDVQSHTLPTSLWTSCPIDATIETDASIRTTPGARGELDLGSGCLIRLNEDTTVTLGNDGTVRLREGQLWCETSEVERTIELAVAAASVTGSNARFDVRLRRESAALIVLRGAVSVRGQAWHARFEAPSLVTLSEQGAREIVEPNDPLLATRWIHDLLLAKPEGNVELRDRVAHLSREMLEASDPRYASVYEQELRLLGRHSAAPLIAWLESGAGDARQRSTAARVLADAVDATEIPKLIALLDDETGAVRDHATRGLQRITGQSLGLPAGEWASASPSQCVSGCSVWQAWWQQSRGRLPGTSLSPNLEPRLKARGPIMKARGPQGETGKKGS